MTTFDTIWNNHLVYTGGKGGLHSRDGGPSLIYIDRHLIHEVTSPQAFEGLRVSGRKVRRPDLTFATMDHNDLQTVGRFQSSTKSLPYRFKH